MEPIQDRRIFIETSDNKARKTFHKLDQMIGPEIWEKSMGNIVEDVPPLPENIREILARPCPFSNNPDETIGKTHMLVLIPKTLDSKPFTLKTLSKHLKSNQNYDTLMLPIDRFKSKSALSEQPVEKSYWALMTKKPFFGNRSWEEQKELIKVSIDQFQYNAPTMLEACTSIVLNYIAFKEILFKKQENECNFTRCEGNYEAVQGDQTTSGNFRVGGYGHYQGRRLRGRVGLLALCKQNEEENPQVGIAPVIRFE